jgi:ribonuclease-3
MTDRAAAVAALEARVGHAFKDRELLERALTHASVGDRRPSALHNELLEFLGDRVLNLIVAEELIRRRPEENEGELSRAFHQLVNLATCAAVARRIRLGDALRLGGGAGKQGIRKSERVLGDACEALIAALYLDAGVETARRFVLDNWADAFAAATSGPLQDPKTRLQHWVLARGLPLPAYRVVARVGSAHAPQFTVEAFVEGFSPEVGQGGSIKEAEKLVAERLLQRLDGGP